MSGKAEMAVIAARELADELHADGQYRAAEIIRRVCRGNSTARVTLRQLWVDNMALRDVVARQAQQLAAMQSVSADA